jgi:hypothetical protein
LSVPPSTEQLIAQLAAGAEPVKRLRPPLLRALFWLIGVAAVAAIVIPSSPISRCSPKRFAIRNSCSSSPARC